MHILACSRTPKALLAPNVSGCFGYCGTCLSERSQREAFPQALAQRHGCEWHLQIFTVWSLALTHFLLPSFSFNKHSTHTHTHCASTPTTHHIPTIILATRAGLQGLWRKYHEISTNWEDRKNYFLWDAVPLKKRKQLVQWRSSWTTCLHFLVWFSTW